MFCFAWSNLLFFVTAICLTNQVNADIVNVTIDWNVTIGVNKLYPTLQVVAVPLMLRSSPIHDAIYSNLQHLNANFVRLLFFSTFPSMSIAQIEAPSNKYYCKHLNGNDNDNNWNLSIQCPDTAIINDIVFASFGSPTGSCGNFSIGSCNADNTLSIVKNLCYGKTKCVIPVNNKTFDISSNINCNNIPYKSFSIQLTCNIDNYQYSNWDFTSYIDELIDDFYSAVNPNKLENKTVLDFGVYPNWKYKNVSYGDGYIDNPYQPSNTYNSIGDILIDPSGSQIGDYFGKVIAYYYNGEFIDEYNQTIINKGKTYPIEILEILNDPDIEHSMTPQIYTILYDNIVTSIIKYTGNNKFKFMGLSLKKYYNFDYFTYFLNKSNHISSDIPIDYISFNFFAACNDNLNCTQQDPNTYSSFFNQADKFINTVNNNITKIRDILSPNTKIDIDEIGVSLSNNNPSQIPDIFWNAANAMYTYIYAKFLKQNINIIGQSFFVGYPDLNKTQFPISPDRLNGFGGSLTMLNYTTAAPNAKYWGLKIIIDHIQIGSDLIKTNIDNIDILHAQAYYAKNVMTILFINKVNKNITVNVNDNGQTKHGEIYVIDINTGQGPARKEAFSTNNPVILQPFATAIAVVNT